MSRHRRQQRKRARRGPTRTLADFGVELTFGEPTRVSGQDYVFRPSADVVYFEVGCELVFGWELPETERATMTVVGVDHAAGSFTFAASKTNSTDA